MSEQRKRKQLHPAKARDVVKALSKIGFSSRMTKSSHVFFKRADGRTTTVPVHAREEIDRTLLRKIAADINFEPEEFMYLIDEGPD